MNETCLYTGHTQLEWKLSGHGLLRDELGCVSGWWNTLSTTCSRCGDPIVQTTREGNGS